MQRLLCRGVPFMTRGLLEGGLRDLNTDIPRAVSLRSSLFLSFLLPFSSTLASLAIFPPLFPPLRTLFSPRPSWARFQISDIALQYSFCSDRLAWHGGKAMTICTYFVLLLTYA
eukprot:scaffold1947_cov116-Skeletonema_dohrnii-CCMP3373.AAC.1